MILTSSLWMLLAAECESSSRFLRVFLLEGVGLFLEVLLREFISFSMFL